LSLSRELTFSSVPADFRRGLSNMNEASFLFTLGLTVAVKAREKVREGERQPREKGRSQTFSKLNKLLAGLPLGESGVEGNSQLPGLELEEDLSLLAKVPVLSEKPSQRVLPPGLHNNAAEKGFGALDRGQRQRGGRGRQGRWGFLQTPMARPHQPGCRKTIIEYEIR